MINKLFAAWERSLNEVELAEALAALGIYIAAGMRKPRADVAQTLVDAVDASGERPIRCVYAPRLTGVTNDPQYLLQAWHAAKRQPGRPRIEIVQESEAKKLLTDKDPAWLANQLQAPAVGAVSSFLTLQPRSSWVEWEWPLRIGFLPDSASQGMKLACISLARTEPWLQQLIQPVDTAKHLQALELLILPGNLSEALQLLENSPYPVYSYLVAVLGGRGNLEWQSVAQKKQRLSELTQAQGVIVAHERLGSWLQSLVRELSHDAPLDVAACNYTTAEPNICFLSAPLLEAVRPSRFAGCMLERAATCDLNANVTLAPALAGMLGLAAQSTPLGRIIDQFDKRIRDIGYFHEYLGATATAAVNVAIRQATTPIGLRFAGQGDARGEIRGKIRTRAPLGFREMPKLPPEPRYLQTEVYAMLSGKRRLRVRSGFAGKKRHEISIFVGILRPDTEILSDHNLPTVFPTEKLPPSDNGGHTLTVVFYEPNLMKHPQLSTLFLPAQEDSGKCRFQLWVPNRSRFVEARITVLHENRVLQTGVLQGEVHKTTPEEHEAAWLNEMAVINPARLSSYQPNTQGRIRLTLSGAVPRAIAELDRRSRFDAAFVLNHSTEETGSSAAGMLGVAGNRSGYIRLTDVDVCTALNGIYKALDSGEWDFKDYASLTAKGTTKLLRSLAIQGSRIYRRVIGGGRFPESVTSAKRIQVVAAKSGSKFPLEFIYEFATPAREAPLCPDARTALLTGVCPNGCQTLASGKAPYVCPLGFWGLSRVIEWHLFSDEQAKSVKDAAFAVNIDEGPRNNELMIAAPALMAYSKKIDEADNKCIPWFKEHAAIRAVTVDSWPEWIKSVKELAPRVLVLLVHTDRDEEGAVLEVGPPLSPKDKEEYRLPTDYLTREHICGPDVVSPIVLLLGCTTNQAKFEFNSVASEFEYQGAKVLVATSNLIYGPKAVQLAELLLAKLHELQDGENFGDVMLTVRRKALAEGNPMVLCLSAYGDADWRLKKGAGDAQH